MKKLLAILLALMMVLVSVAALAADDDPPANGNENPTQGEPNVEDASVPNIVEEQKATLPASFKLTKNYVVTGSTAINPPDTLAFTVSKATRTDSSADITSQGENENKYPVTIASVTVSAEASSADIVIALPSYDLPGVYHYTIRENDGNIAGVTYLGDTLYLKVTIITNQDTGALEIAGIAVHQATEEGTKIDKFENSYGAGSLLVSKTVTGKLGDYNLDFEFTVEFEAPSGDTVALPITVTTPEGQEQTTPATTIATTDWSNGKASVTFTLKHGQSVTFKNVPKGTKYTVTETANEDYETTPETLTFTGTMATSEVPAAFTNDRDIDVDTGVTLDSTVYMLIMALAVAGFVVMKIRRKEDY